jgi:hypothetical protein
MKTELINIRIDGPETSEHFSPPDDPLGELAPYQMQFRRFCYEQNRTVRIGVGPESREISLFPDVCLLMEWLPEKLAALKGGHPATLDFPERQMAIQFVPRGTDVVVTIEKFGTRPASNVCTVDLETASQALDGFITEVMRLARETGYLTTVQIRELVGPAG